MPNLGPLEIALIIVLALLIFGPRRLPEMARAFGQAIQEFKRTSKKVQTEVQSAIEDDDTDTTPSSATPTASANTTKKSA